MKIYNYFRTTALLLMAVVCMQTISAQDINFKFKAEDVAMWKKFMQKPSAVSGKCNLEVVGININQAGFNWDDPNTWKRADGKAFHNGSSQTFVTTVWGVSFNSAAPYSGGTSRVGWTRRAYKEGTQEVFETGKDCEEKWIPYTPGLENLAGKFELTTFATVINCNDTKVDSIRLIMNELYSDNYVQFSRNRNLRQIDLSDSKAKIRQMASYRNNLSDLDAIVLNNVRPDEPDGKGGYTFRILDWLTNIDENNFRLSSMPKFPDGRFFSGYKKQNAFVPEDYQLGGDGETWEYLVDGFIDLSDELEVRSQNTTFVWRDMADGSVVTPDKSVMGRFQFKSSFVGKELVCEMTNSSFDGWICKTQPVKIVAAYTASQEMNKAENKVTVYPNPAQDQVTINGDNIISVKVISFDGKIVMETPLSDNVINIASLASGHYFLQIVTANGVETQKLIKE